MVKNVCIAVVAALFAAACVIGATFAADTKAAPAKPVAKAPAAKPPMPPMAARPGAMPQRGSFSMIGGKLLKIDAADPANVKLEVTNEADNTKHVVTVTPATNITKVTEISELKPGDTVRVMARKIEDKEVAMGVLFGKIKAMPAPRPARTLPAPPVKPQAPPTNIKETAKK